MFKSYSGSWPPEEELYKELNCVKCELLIQLSHVTCAQGPPNHQAFLYAMMIRKCVCVGGKGGGREGEVQVTTA